MTALGERYRLGGVIGAGSFATVHRARDERLDADVAVKVLAENHSLNPEIRERFIAEGRDLRRVGGRHLVSVHDIGQNERQRPYLVLELADRGSLRRRVEEPRGRLARHRRRRARRGEAPRRGGRRRAPRPAGPPRPQPREPAADQHQR
ncbi:protein kinase [Brachybacterium sp. GPGPB12]|uniref:protein kinase n=1 Tax=Brachybacterium sp. GPGPB12 TaxID=3023517 RepID=UPI00313430CD